MTKQSEYEEFTIKVKKDLVRLVSSFFLVLGTVVGAYVIFSIVVFVIEHDELFIPFLLVLFGVFWWITYKYGD